VPRALQLVSGFATVGAAATTVVTPSPGDTFTVPSFDLSSRAYLENFWAVGASADWVRIRSPRMHDANQGIRVRLGGITGQALIPWEATQPLYPVDTPIVEIDQTAAASAAISTLYSFDDLPGVNPRFGTEADVMPRVRQIMGCEVALGAAAAIGSYSAGVALNSTFDNFEAGLDYALLGYETVVSALSVSVVGQDTGNLRIGGPGINNPQVTYDWFVRMSRLTSTAYIPIIAANNKGATLVSQVNNTAIAAQTITLILAELG